MKPNNRLSRLLLGTILGLSPMAGHALGLGKLNVRSTLNEPLRAEIEFTSVADSERRGLRVNLAPRSDFDTAGAQRLPFLSELKFEVIRRPDGQYFLSVKSDRPIEEPFLHFLIQVEWTGGRLVREYTALIDPPAHMVSRPPSVEAPQTATAPVPTESPFVTAVPPPTLPAEQAPAETPAIAEAETKEASEPEAPTETAEAPQPEETATADAAPADPMASKPADPLVSTVPPPESSPAEAGATPETATAPTMPSTPTPTDTTVSSSVPSQYTIVRGDTLWKIAEGVRADSGVTLEQVMLAIFKNNPQAFFQNNLNNLRTGKVLTVPERDEIASVSAPQARVEFRAQYDAWQEYKLKLAASSNALKVNEPAETSTTAPAEATATAPTADQAPQGAPQQPAQPPKTASAPASDPLLKIVRNPGDSQQNPNAGQTEGTTAERTQLAQRATTLEESIESKEMQNRELAEKIDQVRAQIKNEKRLIELENQALAAKQAQQAAKPEPAPTPAPIVETKPAVPTPAPTAEEIKPEPKPETAPAPAPVPTPATAPVAAAPKPPATPAPAAEESKGFVGTLLDDLLNGSMLPVVGGGLAVLLAVILVVYLRRRQRSIAEFEESILASDRISSTESPTGTNENTGQAATTGDTSFLSDFSKTGMGHMQTDEVDPVAEAEVYLAYGRDETAEEILKEAVTKNPDRHELRLKLLEIYHQRNDANAFETLAEELYGALGGPGGKIWDRVEEMGRKLNPNNPMFRGGGMAAAQPRTMGGREERTMPGITPAATLDMPTDAGATMVVNASAPTQVVDKGGIDFDFGAAMTESAGSPKSSGLDFDMGDTATASGSSGDLGGLEFEAPAAPSGGNEIEFESSMSSGAKAGGDDEIKWDLDEGSDVAVASGDAAAAPSGESGTDTHWDETATKLDLAKAYIDMGDADGARGILDEVLAEGNDQQKKQAAELAAQIA